MYKISVRTYPRPKSGPVDTEIVLKKGIYFNLLDEFYDLLNYIFSRWYDRNNTAKIGTHTFSPSEALMKLDDKAYLGEFYAWFSKEVMSITEALMSGMDYTVGETTDDGWHMTISEIME